MPPRTDSRFLFTLGFLDDSDRLYLTARKRFSFRALRDNVQHTVQGGDTLFTLAGKYLRDSTLWWVIADFQPSPILDPTVDLEVGRTIFIPSYRTLHEEVFSELRRAERS